MCVCVIVCNQQVSVEWGRNTRASHCSALPRVDFPAAALAEASADSGESKKCEKNNDYSKQVSRPHMCHQSKKQVVLSQTHITG